MIRRPPRSTLDRSSAASDVYKRQGTQVRDLLHVADVARAFVKLLTSDLTGPVNIGSGVGVSLRHVVETLERAAGRRDAVDFGAIPMRPDEPPAIVADVTR